jgi:UDP-N-acetylmuramoyl-L-alanyl-D-glutamate--2,6-diaminopimelate ligase
MFRKLIPNAIINTSVHLPKAILANLRYGCPSKQIYTIGVTGTDGKTTTSIGLQHLLTTAHQSASLISTVNAVIGDQQIDTGFHVTTPDPRFLQKLIKQVIGQFHNYLVLESTSHGLEQHRLWGVDFNMGIVTNVTHEHLDYHGTYPKYLAAKAKLFKKVQIAILNQDDRSFEALNKYLNQHNPQAGRISYGLRAKADVKAIKISSKPSGINFTCQINKTKFPDYPKSFPVSLPLVGAYNVSNALAVIAAGISLKVDLQLIKQAIQTWPDSPGRMEIMQAKPFIVVVDFAHTPNGLENALTSLRELLPQPSAKLIAVYGAAGLRDYQKRQVMGEIGGRLAEICVFTAEDPRTEDVHAIIDQMTQGVIKAGALQLKQVNKRTKIKKSQHYFLRIPDRQQAITTAICTLAKPGDIVGIFGKGHEQSMCIGTTEHPWSDQEAVKKALS